jgi:signal transduction histidine kinase
MVQKSDQVFRVAAERKGIEIKVASPSDDCEVIADEDGLHDVLQNLIENGLKFSQPGQTIQVSLTAEPSAYRVSVVDEGPGVPEEQREAIFEEWVSIPRAGAPESTGLGLAIARAIIEAHGGTLNYDDGPGKRGACFWFTLPRSEEVVPTNGG